MSIVVRSYKPSDYQKIVSLYKQSNLYGGQFDENRDSEQRLRKRIDADSDAILIAETEDKIVGTVSLIEDGRVAWLFRFCVVDENKEVAQALVDKALSILQTRGHHQVLVYTPVGNTNLYARYEHLGFTKGNDYTCYWKVI